MSTAFARAGQILAGRYELTFPAPTQPTLNGVSAWIARDNARSLQVRAIVISPELPQATRVLDAARRTAFIYDDMTADPTAVSIISVVSDESGAAVITEIPPGRPLSDFDVDRPLEPSLARSIMGAVTSAVNDARRHGVRHLSLTPSDIYLTDDGQVVIDGFGIDAALAEIDLQRPSAELDRDEATGLTRMLAGLLVGKEASAEAVAEAAELTEISPELRDILTKETSGQGAQSPDDLMLRLVPWGDIDLSQLPRSDADNSVEPDEEPEQDVTTPSVASPVAPAEPVSEEDADSAVTSRSDARQFVDDLLGIEAVAAAPAVTWPTLGLPADEKAAVVDEPAVDDEPTVDDEPAVTDGPAVDDEPTVVDQPVAVDDTGTVVAAEPVAEAAVADEPKVNATLITLTFFAVAVLIAAVLGFKMLTRGFDPVEVPTRNTDATASVILVIDDPL